jgi:hypothetical protein
LLNIVIRLILISNEIVSKLVKKNLDSPDEIISSEKEKIELVNLNGFTIARGTLEPDGARKNMSNLKKRMIAAKLRIRR